MDPTETNEVEVKQAEANAKLDEELLFGHIALESDKGIVTSACKALAFDTADAMNAYFEKHQGLFCNQVLTANNQIVAIVNKVFSEEQQQMLEDKADIIRDLEAAKAKERHEAKLEAERINVEAKKEIDRLVALGRKCDANHGAVIEDNAKMKKELTKLRKASK